MKIISAHLLVFVALMVRTGPTGLMKNPRGTILLLITLLLGWRGQGADFSIDASGHHLLLKEKPFFWLADTVWLLAQLPSREELWETAHGLDPSDARDGAATARNGYANLENYLNELAGDPIPSAGDKSGCGRCCARVVISRGWGRARTNSGQ